MSNRARTILVLTVSILATQPGCQQYLQARARRASDAKEAKQKKAHAEAEAEFEAAFDPAFAAEDYAAAAATFTPARAAVLGDAGVYRRDRRKLLYRILEVADGLSGAHRFVEALAVVELAPPLAADADDERRIEWSASTIRERAGEVTAAWRGLRAKVDADVAAGRFATAAARLALMPSGGDPAQTAEAEAQLCALVDRVAATYLRRIFVTTGDGDRALLAKMMASVRAGRYGAAVELVDRADAADVVITVGLAAERLEQSTAATTRTGRYVSGSRLQANPKIKSLQKDIEQLTGDVASKERSIARIRCSGECRSRVAEQDQLARIRERLRGKQQDLARQPAQVNAPVEAELSYPVRVHTSTLHQVVLIDAKPKRGKATSSRPDMTRVSTSEEHDAVAQLGIAAARPTRPDVDAMRGALHAQIVQDSPYVVHNNLEARNQALGERVQAATGAERAELIATWMALNPSSNQDVLKFSDDELTKLLGLPPGAARTLARRTTACWAQGARP
ncbi:MAG: hypothetical protein IPL61_21300 [Myxococcales bacterium]|nr:hypothetical protein [Myxococcales bacterium]